MRVLGVHPGPLMYTRIFLRLEPLGLELVAAAVRQAGHEVALIDLQVESHRDFFGWVGRWQPDVILFSCNYLANVPEIIDLAKAARSRAPRVTICVGGHSASFVAQALIEHADGAIDCVIRGEGEAAIPPLLAAIETGRDLAAVPGVVTASGQGPAPGFVQSLDDLLPARDMLRHRRRPRSLRVDRILARLSMGLLFLQRLDVLRPLVPGNEPREDHRRPPLNPRTRRLHCR
jgi:hopanoid C-3 methylase